MPGEWIHQDDDTRGRSRCTRCTRCIPSNAGLPIRATGQMIMMGKPDAKLSPERTTWKLGAAQAQPQVACSAGRSFQRPGTCGGATVIVLCLVASWHVLVVLRELSWAHCPRLVVQWPIHRHGPSVSGGRTSE